MKTKFPQPGPLPEGLIPWVARFHGSCGCGKRIKKGQQCLYNRTLRKLVCNTCRKLVMAGVPLAQGPTPSEPILDRVKQIYVMPKPLSAQVEEELEVLLSRLRTEFANEYSARRLLCEVMRLPVDSDIVCIAMRYAERCHSCGDDQPAGHAAIWRKSSHRIWCLECRAALVI